MAELVAHGAGEVVCRVDVPGARGGVSGEQSLGQVLESEPIGEPPQIVGQVLLVGQQLDSRLIALQRAGEVSGFVAGDAQQPPGMAATFVLLQRPERRFRARLIVVDPQRIDGLVQVRTDGQLLELVQRRVQLAKDPFGAGGAHHTARRLIRRRRAHGGRGLERGGRGGGLGAKRGGHGDAALVRRASWIAGSCLTGP